MNVKSLEELKEVLKEEKKEYIINMSDADIIMRRNILFFLCGHTFNSGKVIKLNRNEFKIIRN